MTRIVIIGGGPAGYEAALVAAQHGAEVTVVERDGMGGACVLADCVPSKTFIASAGVRVSCAAPPTSGVQRRPDGAPRRPARRQRPGQEPRAGAVRRHPGPRSSARASGSSRHGRASPTRRGPARRTSSRPRRRRRRRGAARRRRAGRHRRHPPGARRRPAGRRADPHLAPALRPAELPEHLIVVGSGVTGAEFVLAYVELGARSRWCPAATGCCPARTPTPPRC